MAYQDAYAGEIFGDVSLNIFLIQEDHEFGDHVVRHGRHGLIHFLKGAVEQRQVIGKRC